MADDAETAKVDQAVAAWAEQNFGPLEGSAAADAKAAFSPSKGTKAPSPQVSPFDSAASAASPTASVGNRYSERPAPTSGLALPPRITQQEAEASVGNPLRELAGQTNDLPSPTPSTSTPRAIAQESDAARRAFEPPPTAPVDDKPLRFSIDSAEQAAVDQRIVKPAAAQDAPSEPRAFEPPPRMASRMTRPSSWPAPSTDTPSPGALSPGSGQPGSAEMHGPQRASLVVEKLGPEEARVGQTCRFVVTVRNAGDSPAHGVVLTDEIPAGATFVRASPIAEQNGSNLRWNLGGIAPGQEIAVEMLVTPTNEGPIGSVARVSFDAHASATTRATRPQLTLRMSADPRVRIGDQHPVTIELHNPGTGVATGVMLSEDLPPEVSHPAGPALEFEVGRLAPGETRRLDLVLTAESSGRVINNIAATADGGLRAEESVEFEVVAPSLAVQIEGPTRRYLERQASYRVSIANPGTASARDVQLVTHLPRGLEFVSANNLGEYDEQSHAVYWSLAELPEGQRGEVELVALPVSAGDHTLRVESQSGDGLRAEETRRVVVEGVASLAFDVRDRHDPIEVGGTAEYDIRVTNEGTKSAEGVLVSVEAPAGMRFTDARGETAARLSDDRAEFAPLQRLAPGAEARFRVVVTGETPGDHRVMVLVSSDDAPQPIRREESTRVFGNE